MPAPGGRARGAAGARVRTSGRPRGRGLGRRWPPVRGAARTPLPARHQGQAAGRAGAARGQRASSDLPLHLLFGSAKERGGFEVEARMCRKLHSELPEGVVEARLHRPDRDLDDLRDLREVETVQIVKDHDDLVLRPKLIDALEDDTTALATLGGLARRFALGREVLRTALLERAEGDALPRTAVVR